VTPQAHRGSGAGTGWGSADRVERFSLRRGMMLVPPDPTKPAVTIHRTPSDHRSWKNVVAQLRAGGLEWPWPPSK